MSHLRKARKYARLFFITTATKFALCLIGVMFSGPAPPPNVTFFDNIYFGWAKVGLCVFIVGLSLIPFYRELMLKETERVDTRRYIGFGFGLDGLTDVMRMAWPSEWHAVLWPFGFPFMVFFLLATHHYYSDDSDGKPRKKRRFKAKWPAWAKRWSQIPRHHRPPTPAPAPSPRPSPLR